jgi:hypothetical protein
MVKLNFKRNSYSKFPTHAGFVNNIASMTAAMLGKRIKIQSVLPGPLLGTV